MRMFRENGGYTAEALSLSVKIEKILEEIFKEYQAKGYESRDIAYVMLDSVHLSELLNRHGT